MFSFTFYLVILLAILQTHTKTNVMYQYDFCGIHGTVPMSAFTIFIYVYPTVPAPVVCLTVITAFSVSALKLDGFLICYYILFLQNSRFGTGYRLFPLPSFFLHVAIGYFGLGVPTSSKSTNFPLFILSTGTWRDSTRSGSGSGSGSGS